MKKGFNFRFILAIAAFIAMIAVFSVAVLFLWNALMPEIFGLPALNYWQAAGMVILARILFGGLRPWRFGAFGRGRDERLFHHGNALREKWKNMSEEERKEFMRGRREFFHHHDCFNEKPDNSGKNAPNNEEGKSE